MGQLDLNTNQDTKIITT